MDNKPITFISQNKDIIIEFSKEKVNRVFSFAKTDEEDRYLYTMIFKNCLGNIIKIIQLSDCEMYILLDNIYNLLYNKLDNMSVSLSCKESTGEFIIFTIDTIYEEPELFAYRDSIQIPVSKQFNTQNIFKVYQHFDNSVVSILSFEISNTVAEFANCIYSICIEGLDISDNISDIIKTNIGTLVNPDFLINPIGKKE